MRVMQCWDDGDVDDKRWAELEEMIAKISEDPKAEWIDVIDFFV